MKSLNPGATEADLCDELTLVNERIDACLVAIANPGNDPTNAKRMLRIYQKRRLALKDRLEQIQQPCLPFS